MLNNEKEIISPYGGELVNILVTGAERDKLIDDSTHYPSIQISQRSLCDIEMLAVGGFSPLNRFMTKADYQRVLTEMRLKDGTLFPIPITLTINREELPARSEWISLRDSRNNLIAVMQLEELFQWDPKLEARLVYSTLDARHW